MKNERFAIHAEVPGEDSVQVYDGDSASDALAFLSNLEGVTRLQANLSAETDKGEKRSFARMAKADGEDKKAILDTVSEIKNWLDELDPNYKNEPIPEKEAVTISKEDVVTLKV